MLSKAEIQNVIRERVVINPVNGCWEWSRALDSSGYGAIRLRMEEGARGVRMKAHRLSFFAFGDTDAGDLLVCHSCDNPKCCNPDHLFAGTHQDNMTDMVRKGRHKTNFNANALIGNKRGAREVVAGGKRFESYTAAAAHFAVSCNAIRKRIKLGWAGYQAI